MERHAVRGEPFVLGVDVDHVEAEMGVAVIRRVPTGVRRRAGRRLVLEQFEVGVAGLEHQLAGGRTGQVDDAVDDRPVAPTRRHHGRKPTTSM